MNKNLVILAVGVMISVAIFFGLRQKEEPVLGDKQEVGLVKTNLDDDAVLGERATAKVGIVEFSDYECPFCKRFADNTLEEIKNNYIETGKVVLVYRDLPLPFHEPAASTEAEAAECAADQGGDKAYYEFHNQIFANSSGNGSGLNQDKLASLADEIGLDGNKLRACLDEGKFKDEVRKDREEATRLGINGTPGFVVGKLSKDGTVEGEIVSGAQSYTVFESVIEKYL